MVKELNGFLVCNVERSETSLAVTFTLPKDEIQRFFASLRMTMRVWLNASTLQPSTCSPFNRSRPLRHLFRERALRAIGIVLHAKVFVDLEQSLLVGDSAQKFFPAGIISKKTRRSGFESPVR